MKYIILSITIYSTIFICKSVFASNSYECNYYNSCEECIKGSSKCVWCAEIHFNGTRCRSEKENLEEWCVDNKINPKSNKRPSENPLPFNSKTDEVVQIKPQKITIDLRPGDSIDFDFSIKLAKDYRVDLYFLVHATNFMREEKQRIIDDCLTIIEEVKQKKQYVYFGTGVFIDKDPFNSPACNLEKTLKECQIHIDEEKKFTTKVTLLKNIEADNVDIGILFAKGIKEKLNLNINIIKTCNCSVTKKATQCSSKGTLRCGKCECNEDRTGKKCECDKKSPGMNPNDNSTCISPASSDGGIICSGHGACVCGECICINKDYTGSYCQCHKNMCPQYNDMACSDHGKCICGECICDPDFTGKDCRFSMAKNNCMDGETECNGRGECIYNNCECKDPSAWDARRNGDLCQLKYSEKSGHSHQCQLLEPIVQCYLNQGGCEPNTEINISGVINLPGNNSANDMANNTANYSENSTVIYMSNATANNSADAWFDCPNIKTGLGCYTAFLYRYNEDSYGMKIIVQTNANCAETYYKFGGICAVLLIASGVIGLVAWKYITTIRDKREYERFVNEAGIIGSTCENPLYAPTTTTYSNPNFRKRSNRRKFSLN
ncbi:jg13180 [Pararge aegeria aegeria]|uniref:Integrin beta n=1 Tax=Pararge aegeria aegeria TaxID=348720 RepID=A0A8S4REB1_9NEOP|nr:jg13180 [Pararge aegeria aegeria]